MPTTSFPEYSASISSFVNNLLASGLAARVRIEIDQRSNLRGMIVGLVIFPGEAELHFREYVDTTLPEVKVMYVYHFQDRNHQLIFRYDNAAHRPALSQPDHKHSGENVIPAVIPNLIQVVDEILNR